MMRVFLYFRMEHETISVFLLFSGIVFLFWGYRIEKSKGQIQELKESLDKVPKTGGSVSIVLRMTTPSSMAASRSKYNT